MAATTGKVPWEPAAKEPYLTAALARHVRDLACDQLPSEAVARAKDVVLDALGGQLACSTLDLGQRAITFARRHAGRPESTVIGTDLKTSAEHAALVNGIFGHGDEIDETLAPFGHASAALVPTVLAVAERERSSGRDMIVALVAAYDVAGRLARAGFNSDVLAPRNFQQGSTAGSMAAAAGAGKLIALDQERLQLAFGLAAEQACGLQSMRTESGHMNKSLHFGIGARNGITAAYLAEAGYGGVYSVLDPPWSVFDAFVPEPKPDELVAELGERYEISGTAFKSFASGRPTHAAIAALFKIMREHNIEADDIATILVRVPTLKHRLLSGALTLNINIEYVMAVAALDRQVGWDQYTVERQADPAVVDMWRRVTSEPDARLDQIQEENLGAFPAEVDVTTKDGRVLTDGMVFPPGHRKNPFTAVELEEKFMYWSTRVLSDDTAGRLLALVRNLDEVVDVNELGDLLRTGPS